MFTVKKEGPNKGRSFFCCREREENRCKFFKWVNENVEEDPLMPGCMVLFSNPPSYKYTVKKTGAMFTSHEKDRKKAYAQFIRSKRKGDKKEDAPDFLQAEKEFVEKRLFSPLQQHLVSSSSTDSSKGYENETVVKKPKLCE